MSVSLQYRVNTTVTEQVETNPPSSQAARCRVEHDRLNASADLDAASSVPVTKVANFDQALTAGAATIDLTALPGINGATVNGSGLKVQLLRVQAKSTNANAITLTEGASNGYELAGNAWKAAVQAGQELTFYANEKAPDIGSGAKTIDLAGTETQALEVLIVMG